jgi:hypothetical protein
VSLMVHGAQTEIYMEEGVDGPQTGTRR